MPTSPSLSSTSSSTSLSVSASESESSFAASVTRIERGDDEEPEFVDGVPDELQCGICLGVAKVAHVTEECGHLYCRDCIMKALYAKKQCPLCRRPLTQANMRKDVRAQRAIHSLRVACLDAQHGCDWTGELADLGRHVRRCSFAKVKCPLYIHGCDAVLDCTEVSAHTWSCPIMARLEGGDVALQREMAIHQRPTYEQFIWAIKKFKSQLDPARSRTFVVHDLKWELEARSWGPCGPSAVRVRPVGHDKRANTITLTLFNTNRERDRVFVVDWPAGVTVRGVHNFINADDLRVPGFLVNGCITVGVALGELCDE